MKTGNCSNNQHISCHDHDECSCVCHSIRTCPLGSNSPKPVPVCTATYEELESGGASYGPLTDEEEDTLLRHF